MPHPTPCQDIRLSRTIRLRTAPEWLPEKFHHRASRIRVTFKPCAGERRLLRRRKVIAPSQWAPLNRVATYGPLEGSRWDKNFMPHMNGIMDASFFPSVRVIGNIKVPQTGSSAGAETMLGYISDMQPGAAFIVYPDRDTASKRCNDYLQPMFRKSPRLRTLMTGNADDFAALRIKLKTMLVYMGWSGSVSSLGNISARYLIGDEIDKWEQNPSKKEASSHKLFRERYRAYKYGAKCWLISTPSDTAGPIWQYLIGEAQIVFTYHVDCPDCGRHQPMGFTQIRWPEEVRDPMRIEEEDLARYVCQHCGSAWTDRKREKALRGGCWRAYGRGLDWDKETLAGKMPLSGDGRELFEYLRAEHPEKIAFYSPGWVSPMVKNSEMAAAFLRGLKDGDAMRYFDTQIKGVAHTPQRQTRKEDAIYALADDRPEQLVPGSGVVAALTAGVDTQDDGFYYEIRAWGWGQSMGSWQVRFGFVRTTAELAQVLFVDEYRDASGLFYPVHLAVIDAMGHRTKEVYDFTRAYPGRTQAYKGASGRKTTPQTWSTIDRYPGTNILIPGGVRLLTADSHYYKDLLAGMLKIKPEDPGAYRMLASVNESDHHGTDYAQQMCVEFVNERNLWDCPEKAANHYWDCAVLGVIAADILQIKFWEKEQV